MATRPGHPAAAFRRVVTAALLAAATMTGAAQAQFLPPGIHPGQGARSGAAAEPTAPAGDASATHARALIEILRDDSSRAGLVAELEKIAGQGVTAGRTAADSESGATDDAPAPAATGPAPAPHATQPSIGNRVAAAVPWLFADFVDGARDIWNELRATVRRLGGFSRLDSAEFWRILRGVAPVALAAVAASVLSRRLMMPVYRRLGRAADRARIVRTAFIAFLAVALDFLTVMIGVVAGVVATEALGGEEDELGAFRMAFLSAFIAAGILLVAIRAIFSPATPHLRPLPASDAAARYWSGRLGVIVILIAVGELFVRGLVAETTTPITARAALVVIYMITGVYMVALILLNRQAPAAHFKRRAAANEDDLTFSILAGMMRHWHYVVIAFLAVLMHQVLTSSGGALPMVFAAAEIVAAFAVGAFVVALISDLSRQGVRLPERLNRAMPALEERINAFVPAFMRLFRFVVLLIWAAYTLQVVGVLSLRDWLERWVGVDVLGAAASVVLIVLAGFLAWLAMASWVDYRLTPHHGHVATSRERTLLALLRNAATVFILIIGLMFVLSELGISIAPLIASAGVLGLAIGFGAQKMVEDIIGGAFIQFENAINVGDVVQAAGITGVVEKLTIRSVGLRDLQGVYHVIPFSAVSTVSNHTKGFGYHVADIGVAHREDVDAAKAEMLAAYDDLKADAELGPKLIGDLEWFGVESLGQSSVVLRARMKTWPGEQWGLGRAYNERLKKRFDAAGIQIAFPQLTLWFGEGKDGSAPPARLATARRGAPRPAAPPRPTETRDGPIRPGSPTDAEAEDPGQDGDR